jgi:hypothetical protein
MHSCTGSPNSSPGITKVKKQLPSGLVTEVYAHPWEWRRVWVRDDGRAVLALSTQGPGFDFWLWTGFEGVAKTEVMNPSTPICLLSIALLGILDPVVCCKRVCESKPAA